MQRFPIVLSIGVAWILGGLVLLAGASGAHAQARSQYKKQMSSYQKQLDELAEQDEWNIAGDVRERARQWLEDAEVLLARGDSQTAGLVIQQVGGAIDLIRSLITRKKLEATAQEQEENYYKRKKETIPTLEDEIEQLRERKEELKRELDKLQQG